MNASPEDQPNHSEGPNESAPSFTPRKRPLLSFVLIAVILAIGAVAAIGITRMKPAAPPKEEAKPEAKKEEHGGAARVEMNPERLKNAALKIETAGPVKVRATIRLYGKVTANEETTAHVSPRFAGIIRSVRKRLGDVVAKGEILATVESNDSLRTYEVRSEIAGTVTAREVTLGEAVNDQKTIFTITDLSTVYVDLNVYREDFAQLKIGSEVLISPSGRSSGENENSADAPAPTLSTLQYLSPFGAENTQSMLARALVPNANGELRPGLFVTAKVTVGAVDAPVAVRAAAVQVLEEKNVVFVREGDAFEARPVTLGLRDQDWVQVTAGVKAGESYVSANSFVLKAEIGKRSADADH
ncbi:MAG: efflux RND transporter periplasmic adaptor subunit [Verrucomicrobia bacterium]|nr:efflux RND transporter periplasmic adaptor subunit [Verrucomicrobiota bacterium]